MSMLPQMQTVKCGAGMTKQKTGQIHDINELVRRFQRTGQIAAPYEARGVFMDVANIGDYQECQNRVIEATNAFMSLPSLVRKRFGNSPAAFMDYMHNLGEDSLAEAVKLGLVEKPVAVNNDANATANKNDGQGA